MSRKNKVSYIDNDEPAFIKRFKERVGYKEGPNVDTKRQNLEYEDNEDDDFKEEEKPTVVVLKKGDLTAAEADKILAEKEKEEPAHVIGDKIVFKRREKRPNESSDSDKIGSSKIEASDSDGASKKKKSKKDKKTKSEKPKKNNLLSFDDDDEEEDS